MLSHIDRELFPDRCEVVVFNDPQRYVYPIFKNGRSALSIYAWQNSLPILLNNQISRCDVIEIYLRPPSERFVSGINTFCQMTMRDNPDLDLVTVSWFARRYLFLNRHYCTQFSWLLNLSRYTSENCKFSLMHVDHLKSWLGQVEPEGVSAVDETQRQMIVQDPNLEMYVRLDQSLFGQIGNNLTMSQICAKMKEADPHAWDYVVQSNITLLNKCIVQD
jgi:hypothetical protein